MVKNNNQAGSMLTIGEASELLHVHINTLRRWSDLGIIRAYRLGPRRDRRFRAEDITILFGENQDIRWNVDKHVSDWAPGFQGGYA